MQNNNSNLDNLFREKLENHEDKVDPFIWQSIQEQLIEPSYFEKKWFRYATYAALFLLTIGLSVAGSHQYFCHIQAQNYNKIEQDSHISKYYSYTTTANAPPQIITQKIEVPVEITKYVEVPVEVTKYVSAANIDEILSKYQYLNYTEEELAKLNDKVELIRSFNLAELPEKTVDKKITALNTIDLTELLVDGLESSIEPINDAHNLVLTEETSGLGMALDGSGSYSYKNEVTTQQLIDNILRKKMTNLKGFQISLGATFINSWILNKRAVKISTNSLQYKFTSGGQYGLTLGYNFNPRLGVELSVAKANQGQRIIHYLDAEEIENEIRLGYLHVPLSIKYKWEQYSSITKNPVVMNYLFGLQYSKLLQIDGLMNKDIIELEDMQHAHDIGFLVGLDYDIFLSSNYFLTIGARSTFGTDLNGILDGLKGNSSSSKTDNFTIGLKASFNYLFRM